MHPSNIVQLYKRDIDKLVKEIESYSQEEKMWLKPPGISNTGANLALHLVGSLNHFIGATLGHTGYIRQRELEFTEKGITRQEIIDKLMETKEMVEKVISSLQQSDLEKDFPLELAGKYTVEYYLVFFALHLNYHLGQINYHRRLTEIS